MIINNELDHLPYADTPISDDERRQVESMIRRQVPPANALHPSVDAVVPLETRSSHTAMLTQEIERYETESVEHDDDVAIGGIDMDKYSEFANEQMYQNLFHALSENSNLQLLLQNSESLGQLHSEYLDGLAAMKAGLDETVDRKRKHIDHINRMRKKRQLDEFKPVGDYLDQRWSQGLEALVDMGVERLEHEHP